MSRARRFAPLLLLPLVVLFFHRLALQGYILARGDVYLYFYPYWEAAATALREGRLPLWNPYLFMGAPLLANSQAGFFYPPTVLTNVAPDARLRHEEIFGPVAPVVTFETEEEAIASANDTEFGLACYVFTRDLDRAFRVCERLETGMIGLNQGIVSNPAAPFGGVKHSGLGREGGRVGIEEFLETKYVAIATTS